MNESFEQAARYLAPSNDAFWHWTEDGSALVWHDGTTIAFRQEIEAMIDRLAPGGLPRFGALVMLLAATRDKWESSAGRRTLGGMARGLQHLQTNVDASPGVKGAQVAFAVAARRVQEVLDRLDAVSRLPEEVRHGKLAKGVLAETVFEPAGKAVEAGVSLEICCAIAQGLPSEALAPRVPTEDPLGRFCADAASLQPGIEQIDAESLLLRARTGLDQAPNPADFEPPNSDQMRRMLNSLRTDTELAGLARVAQNLMAAAHVPRALHAREELPVGGVSDLSNRGSLDRLLVSELANDPLTLAIRVALNEALYLRRESPPRDPPRRRALLLDCGIRTWGVPRVFGIAAALAFSATADPRSALSAYRATAGGAEPINLGARAGLIECMASLEASPHPAAALRAFLDAIADSPDASSEAILITHPDVLADAEFGASLAGLSRDPTFIATVDRNGQFQLFSYSRAGRRLLTQATLDLGALFTHPRAVTPLIVTPNRTALPAIFAADPFPLLLPCTIKPANAVVSQQFGLVGVSGDGRLLQWTSSGKQHRQLTATLPPGRPVGLFDERSNPPAIRAAFVQHRLGIVHVLRVSLEEGKASVERLQLDVPKPNSCCMVGSLLCVISTDAVRAFASGSIRCLASVALPNGLIWRAGRFFSRRRGDWFALAFDGQQLRLEKVPIEHGYFAMFMFDREGLDGPWAVNFDGSVQAAGGEQFKLETPFKGTLRHVRASRDGHRLVGQAGSGLFGVDLRNEKGWTRARVPGDWDGWLLSPEILSSHSLPGMAPKRFSSIFVNRKGELSLISERSQTWTLSSNAVDAVSLQRTDGVPIGGAGQGFKAFKPMPAPEGVRIKLFLAEWSDGSRAVLDSRWLLHLKSADSAVPQLSIVLTTGGLAGWASDGRVFGNPQFLPDGKSEPVGEAIGGLTEILRQFVKRLR